jgi:hypothetical protein
MGREPPSRQRRVALAGADVDLVVGVFTVAVDDVFAVERGIFFEWFVRPKAVGIDSERLLLAVGEQESNRRLVCGFRRNHVPLSGAAIGEDEHGRLVAIVRTTPARGQATRARRTVALAAFLPGRDVHFVDFDRPNEIEGRRIERSGEALDAPVDRLVSHLDFAL